ncbi:exported hypothetical protein [Nostocoides australiense Ben110]|uniref:Uncharacterized protein n=1 Tax=Nostocoides australiense Ben110 TaxID=1193182 RepID=W6JV89_9MICO|nr:exported hypothetical protein [Tetrasphaera australiensis Ben110]
MILLVAAIGSLVTDAMAMVALLLRVHAQSPASWWPRSFSACRRGSTESRQIPPGWSSCHVTAFANCVVTRRSCSSCGRCCRSSSPWNP